MADATPPHADLPVTADLERALAHPEPMCLVTLEIIEAGGVAPGWVVDEAEARLLETLRDYDELTVLDEGRFVLVLRTLADASVLGTRMQSVYELLTRPYRSGDAEADVVVCLGAAVRVPQETSAQLVARVDRALLEARRSPDRRAVMAPGA